MADMQISLLNAFAGIADPELRRLAEKAVKRFDASIPDESLLRSEFAERFFGFLKGFIESQSRKLNPLSDAGIEKVIDLLDFAAADFFYENGRAANSIAQDWMRKSLERADERINDAVDADAMRDELEQFRTEFEVRKQIVVMVEDAVAGQIQDELKCPIDWDAKLRNWTDAIEDLRKQIRKKDMQ